jgi:glycosyltransferase involved in cell wall biosynthesis
MNILILNTQIPFCYGGAEVLAEDLQQALQRSGHRAEILTLPFKWNPQQSLVNSILASKLMDISSFNAVTVDKVIALKFPLWLIPHDDMSLWILHQHRAAYDLWDSSMSDMAAMPDGKSLRELIRREDTAAIGRRSQVRVDSYGDYFFFPSRITPLKRQELIVEALAYVPEPVKVVFAGEADSPSYLEQLKKRAAELGVDGKIEWRGRISEEEKLDLYANALMVIFTPVDEDYGYVTPEALLSSKGVLTLRDAGGATEFVQHEKNGFIEQPDARSVAMAISRAWNDRGMVENMGVEARAIVDRLDLSWDKVLEALL